MPVECEEFLAAAGFMPQNHDRPVVQRSRIVRDDVDHAIQRRTDRSARLDKKVHAKVNRAPFIRRIAARTEQWRSVKQSWFIVTADTNGGAGTLHCVKYFFRKCGSFRCARVSTKKRTAGTQIKNEARGPSHISIQNRGRGAGVRFQPLLDLFSLRNWGKPASRTKSVLRETRVNFFEPFQGLPSGRFADRNVRVVRLEGFAVCGIRDADGEPRSDQCIKNG